MLQLGWWPPWWTSILLNDAYRRSESSERVDGRTESKTEGSFFGRFISIRRCLAVLAYSYGDEDQTNDNQTFNRSYVQL